MISLLSLLSCFFWIKGSESLTSNNQKNGNFTPYKPLKRGSDRCNKLLLGNNKDLSRTLIDVENYNGQKTSMIILSNHRGYSVFGRNGGDGSSSSFASFATNKFKLSYFVEQYRLREAADPNFLSKSITEVFLAAGTQLTAEISRRGLSSIVPEIDFVVAGVLTAIAGKYYSMWRVAPTAKTTMENKQDESMANDQTLTFWKTKVPTNAFQPFLLDRVTRPTLLGRLAAFLVPIPSLFQAGMIASALGYGLTAILISLRSFFKPSYLAATVQVNILHACLYTGGFMAIISNVRYQVLQGIIEPHLIDRFFAKRSPTIHKLLVFLVRLGNGLLGSTLAIMGMKYLGLQRLK